MAESKGALIAKSVQKHAGRAKEKVFIVLCYLTCKCSVWNVTVFSRFYTAVCRESGFLMGFESRSGVSCPSDVSGWCSCAIIFTCCFEQV